MPVAGYLKINVPTLLPYQFTSVIVNYNSYTVCANCIFNEEAEMFMEVDPSSSIPVYAQIVDQIKNA